MDKRKGVGIKFTKGDRKVYMEDISTRTYGSLRDDVGRGNELESRDPKGSLMR
jgi:hypothetical protein